MSAVKRKPKTPRSGAKDALIEHCRSLPGAIEDVKWGADLIFSVGGKMFAGFQLPDGQPVAFRVAPPVFEELVGRKGVVPAPYMAKHSWVSVTDRSQIPAATLKNLLAESYRLVAEKLSKKLRSTLGIAILVAAVLALARCAPGGHSSADVDQLRALHEKVIRAHRESDVELLLVDDAAADYVVANRGEVTRPSVAERRERLGPYLRSTQFEEYRDLIEPVVRVSADGSSGWVIVQVQAAGVQTTSAGQTEPVAFVSAWIELYEKRDGRWLRVGNVSNFKP